MDVTYCENWSFKLNGPGTVLTENEARQCWDSGEAFTAVVPGRSPDGRTALVTVCWKRDHLGTAFPDRFGRKGLEYSFRRVDADRLFLKHVFVYEYPNEEPDLRVGKAVRRTEVTYHGEDRLTRVVTDKEARTKEVTDYSDIDFTPNWEPVPEFGNWASVARQDRTPSVADDDGGTG
ncbi:hypothetical protein [Nocardiopsis suaedae]|uniref:Uncharacterized protein n=1 Tax=Nocardiopsis suaedae TaxID=3018444 RepID=A0ABT4TVF7_9ACTN|nr:hypothetical protein [Nocardiopsis suaedae]MDA2808683.1 hypothetical protein [Nocardiopsis suaedae]